MIRVELNRDLCSGHARCNAAAAALFALDDLGYVDLPDGYVDTSQEDLVARGVAACPERALTISDQPTRSGAW